MNQSKYVVLLSLLFSVFACNGLESPPVAESSLPDSSVSDPVNPETPSTPDNSTNDYTTAVLLFNGTGVSTSDWQSTETIVKSMGLSYQLVNTAQMNALSLDQLSNYGVIIVPGGSGGTIYSNLTTATRLRIRQAIRDNGVGYVGFCAGAWVAVGPEADTNSTASYGFAVAEGDILPYWYPDGNTSLVTAMVDVSFSDGTKRSLVWYGGPSTPEWSSGVIARYDNGKPAISQTFSGSGFVVISGPHPEAPEGWRASAGFDSDGLDFDIVKAMINAALNRTAMAAF